LGLAGFAFGAPLGISASPKAGTFALVAYGTGLLAFGAGYREPSDRTLSLASVLTVTSAPLAIYGVLQAIAPLTSWDSQWLQRVGPGFGAVGSKEDGTLRVFSTLNAPATLAVVLSVAIVCVLASRRFGPLRSAILVATIAGLALTLVRSAWVSLVLALVLLFLVAPVRVGRRIFWVGLLTVLAFPVLAAGNPQLIRVSKRAQTVTTPGQDVSVQQRLATPQQLVPQAIREPLGNGLGSAGEASRLSQHASELRATDNALLSIVFQCGPVGFILVMAAYVLGGVSAVRNVRRGRTMNDVLVFGCIALTTTLLITQDVFYGVTGTIVWYLLGYAVRRDDARRLRPSTA
jgi:putative inorganic carbon (HCO3(-)) transporter